MEGWKRRGGLGVEMGVGLKDEWGEVGGRRSRGLGMEVVRGWRRNGVEAERRQMLTCGTARGWK